MQGEIQIKIYSNCVTLPTSHRYPVWPKKRKNIDLEPNFQRMESFAEQSEFLLARKKLSTKLAANWRNKNRSKKKYPGQSLIKKLPPPLLFPPSTEPKILVHMFFSSF